MAHPVSYPMGTVIVDPFRGVKRLVREADHPPSSGTEVKNPWSSTSSPHTSLWCRA
jgi:hypothetical protein